MGDKYVKCINDRACDDLTLNKIYKVVGEDEWRYIIIEDRDQKWGYKKEYFELVEGNNL